MTTRYQKVPCQEHCWRIHARRRVRGLLLVTWKCLDCRATRELEGEARP